MVNSNCPGREKLLKKAHSSYPAYLKHCQRLNQARRTLGIKRCNLWLFHQWLGSQGIGSPLEVNANHLESFIQYLSSEYTPRNNKSVSKGSLSRYVGLLIQFYGFLVKERLLLSNPTGALQHPRKAKRLPKDILTPDEFRLLLNRLSAETPLLLRDAVAVRILMFSGMRLNELCHVEVSDLNLRDREIFIRFGKGNKQRLSFIDHSTQKWLAQYLVSARPQLALSSTKALLVLDKGTQITPAKIQDIVSLYVNTARIRKHITPHSFRRTLCSLLLQAGTNIKVISEIVGHSNLSTTAVYTEIDTETLTRVYQQGHPRA